MGARPPIYTVGPYSHSRGNLAVGAKANDCRYLSVRHLVFEAKLRVLLGCPSQRGPDLRGRQNSLEDDNLGTRLGPRSLIAD